MIATILDSNGTERMNIDFDGESIGAAEEAFEFMKSAMELINVQAKVISIKIRIS